MDISTASVGFFAELDTTFDCPLLGPLRLLCMDGREGGGVVVCSDKEGISMRSLR